MGWRGGWGVGGGEGGMLKEELLYKFLMSCLFLL